MLTSEVLDRAADEIERRGWVQGSGWNLDSGGPTCLEGAIATVLEWDRDMPMSFGALSACPAGQAVRAYLDMNPKIGEAREWCTGSGAATACAPLFYWNDTPGRTAAEVIEVLRAAAMVERTREAAAVAEAVSA